jgi:heme/copper-type cytochrome/quinol oxidase subunit 2
MSQPTIVPRFSLSALSAGLPLAVVGLFLGPLHPTRAALVEGGNGPQLLVGLDDDKQANAVIQAGAVGRANDVVSGLNGNDVNFWVRGDGSEAFVGGPDVEMVKTIDVVASRFQFEPATISVVQGDTVRLRLRSADRTHSFAIRAFRVKALIPKAGEAVTVEFVADQAGTFDFTCAEYCGTGHAGMKGRLVVLATGK